MEVSSDSVVSNLFTLWSPGVGYGHNGGRNLTQVNLEKNKPSYINI